ncbi:MAG: AI-2E family transporter [Anaerolineae bacterium]|nr:AI-2E family transporter [Anaerolineae bacterium]
MNRPMNRPDGPLRLASANNVVTRGILISFAIALAFLALWQVKDIVMLSLTAVIIAILLTSPVRFFMRHGLRRWMAVGLSIVLILFTIALVTALILPSLLEQFRILAVQTIPSAWDLIQQELQPDVLTARYPFLRGLVTDWPTQLNEQLGNVLSTLGEQLFPFLSNVLSTLVSFLIVIFLSLYFIADPDTHWRGTLRLLPLSYRPRAREILARLDLTLRRYLQAQVLLMLLTGTAVTVVLALMRVPLAGALGVITGLFSFVPNFGPIVALIPIAAVAVINTPDQVFQLLLIYFGIQFVVSQIVTPLLFGQEINLPPAVILLAQIVAGVFFGFLGVLLSAPLAAIVSVLVREVYIHDVLGDTEIGQRRSMDMARVEQSLLTHNAPDARPTGAGPRLPGT